MADEWHNNILYTLQRLSKKVQFKGHFSVNSINFLSSTSLKTIFCKYSVALLISMILKWALVFYYRGDINGLQSLLSRHESDAQALQDRSMLGMFKAWTGFSMWNQGKRLDEAYERLQSAAQMGQEIDDPRVVGYASAWLTWVCGELGKFDEAITHGQKALKIANGFPTDPYLNFKPLGGMGWSYSFKGDANKAIELGKTSLGYGQKHANVRSIVLGYLSMGFGYQTQGDLKSAIESFQSALLTSKDPLYGQGAEVLLGHCYILSSQYDKAEELLRDGSDFYRRFGNGMTGVPADLGLGAVLISQGRMTEGLNKIKDARRILSENQRRGFYIVAEYMLGKITFDDQIKAGKAKLVGDRKPYEQLKSILVQFTPDFEILPGTKAKPSKSDKSPFEQDPPAWTDGG